MYPADLLAYFTGLDPEAPLSNPIIKGSPAFTGPTQQTAWGAINAYTNSFSVSSIYLYKIQ